MERAQAIVVGAIPGHPTVLGSITKQAEQATSLKKKKKKKPVISTPPWSLHQLLPPGTVLPGESNHPSSPQLLSLGTVLHHSGHSNTVPSLQNSEHTCKRSCAKEGGGSPCIAKNKKTGKKTKYLCRASPLPRI